MAMPAHKESGWNRAAIPKVPAQNPWYLEPCSTKVASRV